MAPSSVPTIGVPMIGEAPASGRTKVYASRPTTQWQLGIISIGLGLVGLLPLRGVSNWLSGGPILGKRRHHREAVRYSLARPTGALSASRSS